MDKEVLLTYILTLAPNYQSIDYSFLMRQNWTSAKLIIVEPDQKNIVQFKENYAPAIAIIPLTFVFSAQEAIQHIDTPWFTFINTYEVLADTCTTTLCQLLKITSTESIRLYYGIGFVASANEVRYAQEIMPALNQDYSIENLFDHNEWFSPFVKYIYSTKIASDYYLTLPSVADSMLQYASFHINYTACLFELNNYYEPPSQYIPLGFISKQPSTELSEQNTYNTREILSFLKNKSSLLMKRFGTKLYYKVLRHKFISR